MRCLSARRLWQIDLPKRGPNGSAISVSTVLREAGDGRGVLMGVLEDVPTAEHMAVLAEETRNWKPENHT